MYGPTCANEPYARSTVGGHHDQHIAFISKNQLARQMLSALQAALPADLDLPVYVLHDTWYASARLLTVTHRQGWHTITGLKHNRKLNGQRLD